MRWGVGCGRPGPWKRFKLWRLRRAIKRAWNAKDYTTWNLLLDEWQSYGKGYGEL